MEIPKICRYCGGVVRLVPAAEVYGAAAARRLGIERAYHWMAKKLRLSEQLAHIGGFEMDRCQRLIDLCEKERNKEAA